jgi:hypothetical protein
MINLVPLRSISNAILIASALLFASCNQSLYGPSDLQITPMRDKNDNRIGGQVVMVGEAKGVGAQGIVSLKRGLSAKGQFNVMHGKGYTDNFLLSTFERTTVTALTANVETLIGSHRQLHERFWAGIFAGGGLNRITYWYNGAAKSSLNFSRYCLQPELVFTTSYVDLGFGMRTSYVNYYSGSINVSAPSSAIKNYAYITNENNDYFISEGQIMLGGGKGRFYVRNSMTFILSKQQEPFFSRLQLGTSLLYTLQGKK